MKPLRKILLTSLGILPFFAPVDVANADPVGNADELMSSASELPWRKARFMVEAQSGTRSIATLDAMVPFMGDDDFMVYANIMAKMGTGANNANGNTFEGNAGLGFRRVNDAENAIYGAYVFYDSLRSVNNNTFTQATVGVERLGLTWDFRANAYIPFGKTKYNDVVHNTHGSIIQGHDVIESVKTRDEYANSGGDLEVGRTLGSNKLRGYFAAYSFGKDLTGPRVRLEYRLNSHITVTSTAQYDKSREGQFLLGARFALGGTQASNGNSIYERMTDVVVRDVDVVTSIDEFNSTLLAKNKIWVVDPDKGVNEGDGTYENPFGFIDEAIESAPEGTNIIVIGKDGASYQMRDYLEMRPGQKIWGAVDDLFVNVTKDGDVNISTSSTTDATQIDIGNGVRPVFNGSIKMNNNTSINNIDVTTGMNDATQGIVVDGVHNVSINNVNVTGNDLATSDQGIYINNSDNVSLNNVDASGFNQLSNERGILIKDSNNVSLEDITLDDNYVGIEMLNSNVDSNNMHITNSVGDGMLINKGVQNHSNLNVEHSGGTGIHMFDGKVTLSNLLIDDSNIAGILLETDGDDTENRSLTITADQNGEDADPWKITNTHASAGESADDGHGIWVKDYSTITASNGLISNNDGVGLRLEKGTFNISDTTFSENFNGINIGDGSIEKSKDTSTLDNVTIDKSVRSGLIVNGANVIATDTNLTNNDGNGAVLIAGELEFYNADIDNNGIFGIFAVDPESNNQVYRKLNVVNSTIHNTRNTPEENPEQLGTGHGIAIDNMTEVTIMGSKIIDNALDGIVGRTGNYEIKDTVVSNNEGNGIRLYKMFDSGSTYASPNAKLIDVTVSGNKGAYGVEFFSPTGTSELLISSSHITDNYQNGLMVRGSKIDLEFTEISGNMGFGLTGFGDANHIITLQGMTIKGNGTNVDQRYSAYYKRIGSNYIEADK